jgi:two-component system, LuxR family, sensor kinase FixL
MKRHHSQRLLSLLLVLILVTPEARARQPVYSRYGLLQVFLNLAKNSQRAMGISERRQLTISSAVEPSYVVIRFEDTGVGIHDPSDLFRPFAQSANAAGLGLYVSRAILRSFRGDLQHEPSSEGCCFIVSLARYINAGDIHK